MSVPIIGLCGKKGHGKDTFASLLVKHHPDYKTIGFADKLRRCASDVFGLTYDQMTVPSEKEKTFDDPIIIDNFLPEMGEMLKLKLEPRELIAWSPRKLLQYVGTEYVRSIQDSYWVDCVMDTIAGKHKRTTPAGCFVITDARFSNEAAAIADAGGILVRILRLAMLDTAVGSKHASEALDFKWDNTLALVENNFSLSDYIASQPTYVAVRLMLRQYDWDAVLDFPGMWDKLYYGNYVSNPLLGGVKI